MTPAARGRRAGCAAITLVAGLALAGCGSDGGTAPPTSAAPSTTAASSPDTSSDPPTASDSPTPSDSPTTATPSASSTPPASSSAAPTPAAATCTSLDVAVTRVPGAAGVTYGLVAVTNRGSGRCALPGVPSLRLLDATREPMTAVATAQTGTGTVTELDPGAVASTLLEDRSSDCQANERSTYVEVRATSASPVVVAALALPPCPLAVKPFVPGSQPSP